MKDVWKLYSQGFNYNVVSVFGSQSTGKSTLLNHLFNTSFDVMNEKQRSQTTKGIWCSRDPEAPILVLDVEGTDGHERAQDEDFERKSSLFALAISEVLIVNMFENQVGLYKGANMALLRTVLEVNLQIFQQSSSLKTCLLFVVRDFEGLTPLENHEKVLTGNLNLIWENLSKPEGKEDWKLEDLFDIKVFGLPHKNYKPAEFIESTKSLLKLFHDKSNSNYIFKSNYHKHIPADGFSLFLKSVWEKIQSNKDLDLPSQQLLLAQFRCDEILRDTINQFTEKNQKIVEPLEIGQVVEDLGAKWKSLINESIALFDSNASRYHESVYSAKKQELFTLIQKELHPYYLDQLTNLNKKSMDIFFTQLEGLTATNSGFENSFDELSLNGFASTLNTALNTADKYFIKIATSSKIPESGWSHVKQYNEFKKELDKIATERHRQAMNKIVEESSKDINRLLEEDIVRLLNLSDEKVWSQITVRLNNGVQYLSADLQDKLKSFGASKEDADKCIDLAKKDEWKFVYEVLDRESRENAVVSRIVNRFENKFSLVDGEIPRIWEPTDNIDAEYLNSKKHALSVLDILSIASLEFDTLDPVISVAARSDMVKHRLLNDDSSKQLNGLSPRSLPSTPMKQVKADSSSALDTRKAEASSLDDKALLLISATRKKNISELADKEFQKKCFEAKSSVISRTAKIPSWVYIALLALGWNELMAIFSSPITFIFSAFVVVILYFLYKANLVKPLISVAKTQLRTILVPEN